MLSTGHPLQVGSTGGYKIDAEITAQDDKTFTQTSSQFTLSDDDGDDGVTGGGGATGGGVVVVTPGVTNISNVTTSTGVFTRTVNAKSANGKVNLTITTGTIGRTQAGNPLTQLNITIIVDPPGPPANASIVGSTYDLEPDGATFDSPVEISFNYDPTKIPAGINEEYLLIAWWDEDNVEWVVLEDSIVDTIANTVTAPLIHFTAFTIITSAPVPPAPPVPGVFTTSSLVISPAEINAGASTTIRITVTNTGGLSGSYQVTLKINNVTEDTKSVTLAGGASQSVSFTTTRGTAGTYTVAIDSLSGYPLRSKLRSPLNP